MKKTYKIFATIFLLMFAGLFFANCVSAQDFVIPKFNFIQPAKTAEDVTMTLQVFFLLTVLSLAPALFMMTTCFARVTIVLGFLKQASGINQMPQQIVVSLALFVTAMIMMPVWEDVNENALQPYIHHEITQQQALEKAINPIRNFMLRQTREKDIGLFVYFAQIKKPQSESDVPMYVLMPAFMISEMKTAFIYGFLLFLPFLIVDMVTASVLLSMGMMVLPPMLIATPFKIILFILVDGWYLVLRSLVGSFH